MNAEAEKIQDIVKCGGGNKLDDLLCIDKSVGKILRDVIKSEFLQNCVKSLTVFPFLFIIPNSM